MKKFSSSGTDKLLIRYVIKVLLSTVLSILLFSFLFSEIVYKLDLDLDLNRIFSIFIICFCSATISYISVRSIKNNGALMGVISQIPLIFYSIINLIFYDNSFLLFLIKIVLILLIGALFGIFATKKSNKFKVK